MNEPFSDYPDPLACAEALRESLADPELDSPDPYIAGEAALEVAVALGRCRIFGVNPGDDLDGTLPPEFATSAAGALIANLRRDVEDAKNLGEEWDSCEEFAEADELIFDILHRRMDVWAAFVALDEAWLDAVDQQSTNLALHSSVDAILDLMEQFDQHLRLETGLLSIVTASQLLDNWRSVLASPWRELPPWWLDGTLEKAAQRSHEEALAFDRTLSSADDKAAPCVSPPGSSLRPDWTKTRDMLLACAPDTDGEDSVRKLIWDDPSGALVAEAIIPPSFDHPDATITILFRRSDRTMAKGLSLTAEFAGIRRTIDPNGTVKFQLRELTQDMKPDLKVADVVWPLRTSS